MGTTAYSFGFGDGTCEPCAQQWACCCDTAAMHCMLRRGQVVRDGLWEVQRKWPRPSCGLRGPATGNWYRLGDGTCRWSSGKMHFMLRLWQVAPEALW